MQFVDDHMLSRHVIASLAQWEDHVFSRLDLAFQLMQDNVFSRHVSRHEWEDIAVEADENVEDDSEQSGFYGSTRSGAGVRPTHTESVKRKSKNQSGVHVEVRGLLITRRVLT